MKEMITGKKIMGILNLTDDSYFACSRCQDMSSALNRMGKMLVEGADIIDIGACSTRPGAVQVGLEEEWSRLEPLLGVLRKEYPETEISIDTYRSEIVLRAYDMIGKFIVNDISAGEDDPVMLERVGSLGLPYIAMHKRGNPETMQQMCCYDDVSGEVLSYFEAFARRAERAGISEWILDPGFGFAKTVEQNYTLLKDLKIFKKPFGRESRIPQLLVGISRKRMIYEPLDLTPEEVLPATQALHMVALGNGADILRVHDVAEARNTVKLFGMLAQSSMQ